VRILVAGIGNIFLADDGFGPAVIARLRGSHDVEGVEIADYGIRGMDLALALTDGVDAAILVDATPRGGAPGTLYVIDPVRPDAQGIAPQALDAHALHPAAVLGLARTLGTLPAQLRVLGCEPGAFPADDDVEVGLSPAVAAAIEPAARLVVQLISEVQHA
jgi:hydrogenase maturation protease